jgi:hypothetical protein
MLTFLKWTVVVCASLGVLVNLTRYITGAGITSREHAFDVMALAANQVMLAVAAVYWVAN